MIEKQRSGTWSVCKELLFGEHFVNIGQIKSEITGFQEILLKLKIKKLIQAKHSLPGKA